MPEHMPHPFSPRRGALIWMSLAVATTAWTGAAQSPPAAGARDAGAHDLVRRALDALGGEDRLRQRAFVELEAFSHVNLLEQSERPEGPWLVVYEDFHERRDLVNGIVERRSRRRGFVEPPGSPELIWTVGDGVASVRRGTAARPVPFAMAEDIAELAACWPDRVLLAAQVAADLRAAGSSSVQGVPHDVVELSLAGRPARIELNAETGLPTAIDIRRAYPDSYYWGVWGDVHTRYLFSLWSLEPDGSRQPRQIDVDRNGQRLRVVTVASIDTRGVDDAEALAPPAGSAPAPRSSIQDLRPAANTVAEIADGVVQISGAWNVVAVRQDDGVIILEAPISAGYSAAVLDLVAERFPGVPVRAVVSTSDAWPHIGGLREYAARSIPIYTHSRNLPIVGRLLSATFDTEPDSLARGPRKADVRPVRSRMTVGAGPRRLVLAPVSGEGSERMLLAYLPELRLLYGADLVQPMPDGSFFFVQYLAELAAAAEREGLDVDRVCAIHSAPMEWRRVLDAIGDAR